MSEVEKLLVVQKNDMRIRELEQTLRDIPARKAQEQARLSEHRQALEQAEGDLRASQAGIRDLDVEAQTHKEKIAKLRTQQLELKTNKEFKAIETEIKLLMDQIAGLEDRELAIMEKVESAQEDVATRKAELKKEEATVQADIGAWDVRVAEMEAELAALRAVRAKAARDVNPRWLTRYDLVMSRKQPALVSVEDEVCGGCHMKVAPYLVHASRRRTELATCEFCGRLLC